MDDRDQRPLWVISGHVQRGTVALAQRMTRSSKNSAAEQLAAQEAPAHGIHSGREFTQRLIAVEPRVLVKDIGVDRRSSQLQIHARVFAQRGIVN